MDELISIIVPIYNAKEYLTRCLEAVKQQDYMHFEVLLVDDGSTDDSADICKIYCDADSRFRYIRQENSGPDMARKAGTKAACGDYLLYADADDHIAENMLSVMLTEAKKTRADIVCSQIVRFDDKKEWDGSKYTTVTSLLTDKKEIYKAFFEEETLIGTYYAKLIRKSIMEDYEFVKDGLIGEDITAALYMFDKASKVAVIPDKLYYYFQNHGSISHAKYSFRHELSLDNYIRVRDDLLGKDIVCPERLCGYFAGYEMAVATAMGRSGRYIVSSGEKLRKDLKKYWKYIKYDNKTKLYMKLCIILFIYCPRVFVLLYRILFIMTGR